MKGILILASLMLITSCQKTLLADSEPNNYSDYELILSALLEENQKRFTYKDSSGKNRFDELKEFKALESIYIQNIEPVKGSSKLTNKQIKTIMFFAFYAKEINSAAFQEYLASDLLPLYLKNKNIFLTVLNNKPFLIDANCSRLNAYFSFEDQQTISRSNFIKLNKAIFSKVLNADNFKRCFQHFH